MRLIDASFQFAPASLQTFESTCKRIVSAKDIRIDAEVPFRRKSLVRISLSEMVATDA